ncbi:MAG: hypothetical protein QOH01_1175 [Verrucomicrobiota bacterium]|jgi:hypothetical protein
MWKIRGSWFGRMDPLAPEWRLRSKSEARNTKQYRMPQDENPKRFDLEDRTFAFAKSFAALLRH